MTRIVATSDLHGELPDIPECDLLIIAGDICPDGPPAFQAKWLDGECRKWLEGISSQEIVLVAGNHDQIFEKESYLPKDLPWYYLKDSSIDLFGFKIYGTPWQLPFWGAFNLPEEELAKKYANIPKDVDIFISHGPAFEILDEVGKFKIQHTGSRSLKNKVFEIKPKLFICGHIHEAYGMCTSEGIIFANVSLLNDRMEVAHEPIIFNMEPTLSG